MTLKRYLLAGVFVGLLSVIYNFLVFYVFKFYPDAVLEFVSWPLSIGVFYFLIFLKSFFIGLILMVLFSIGYRNIRKDDDSGGYAAKGIFFIILYAIFALFVFSFGDMVLMKTQEGMLLLLTVDGFVETLIAMVPIRLLYRNELSR